MLQVYKENQYVTRIISDSYGRNFKVIFAIVENNGQLKGRIVSVEPILSLNGKTATCGSLLLCGATPSQYIEDKTASKISFVSPYYSLEFLINSQPIRAPSIAL
ncbi:MAG: hypothetical protein M1459_00055 [Patescibacteria group bacterium]|nr:hypothetical protein [Patescibacteria group bacterium]